MMRAKVNAVSMTQLSMGAQRTASPARSHAKDWRAERRVARVTHPLVVMQAKDHNLETQLASQGNPSVPWA
jgi:hypothetical protein